MTQNHAQAAAEAQQVKDARDLLEVALVELSDCQKTYARIENNVRIFVDRTNHELAALALVIQQKVENVETLKKMVAGYYIKPEAAAVSAEKQAERAKVQAESVSKSEPEKTNGTAEPASTAEATP